MPREAFSFNLGPISRTIGPNYDYIAFASLPVHEVVTALLGARNRDEFIDWLWHDTFKALFHWEIGKQGRKNWLHVREDNMRRLASAIQVSADRVIEHHSRNSPLLKEHQTVTNEFGAIRLGESARFVQLTFKCQPAASTMVLRLAIVEAFLRALSEVVGDAIRNLGLPFTHVSYIFDGRDDPAWTEDDVADQYQMSIQGSTLMIFHVVPSSNFGHVELTVDLTGAPPDLRNPQVLALPELLTVYGDDLTVIAALPLFIPDPGRAVTEIQNRMATLATDILREIGVATRHKRQTGNKDLLQIALDEQVEIRLVDGPNKLVHVLISHPYTLMGDSSLNSRCLVCGSPIQGGKGRYFKAGKNVLSDLFSDRFTDLEHVGFEDDICPMCLIYASSDNKKLLRGAVAILTPSTSLRAPISHRLIEQPRFDKAGRFDPNQPMVKAGMTLQELVLLTLLSRRIIARLVPFDTQPGGAMTGDITMHRAVRGQSGASVVGKYLPYSGSYLVFDPKAVTQFFRAVFLEEDLPGYDVWQEVQLTAYPFELNLSPSFTMLMELRQNADLKAHAQMHTLLKVKPTVVYLSRDSAFYVLVDNSVQERVDREYVETWRLLERLASAVRVNRYEFIRALLSGEDPLTAAYDVARPPKGVATDPDIFRMSAVSNISKLEEVMGQGTPEEMWNTFIRQREMLRSLCQEHPTLIYFFTKPKGG